MTGTSGTIAATPVASMIIRGQVITGDLVEIAGRGRDLTFMTPDANKYVGVLPLSDPGQLRDLYDLSFEQILGMCLSFDHARPWPRPAGDR